MGTQVSQRLAESGHEEHRRQLDTAKDTLLPLHGLLGALQLCLDARGDVLDARRRVGPQRLPHRPGVRIPVEGTALGRPGGDVLGQGHVRGGEVSQEVIQLHLQFRIQGRAEVLDTRADGLRLHGEPAAGQGPSVCHAHPGGVRRQVLRALGPQEERHVVLHVDVLIGTGAAGAALKLLQGRDEQLLGAGGDGVKAFFGQSLKESERGAPVRTPSGNLPPAAVHPGTLRVLQHAQEDDAVVAEKGVVTDGYRRAPDQVTEAWSRSAPESGSLLISRFIFQKSHPRVS